MKAGIEVASDERLGSPARGRNARPASPTRFGRSLLASAAFAFCVGLASHGAFVETAAAEGAKKLPDTIVVGATLPLTGPGGAYGQIMQAGLQLGLDEAVSQGVIGASKFKLELRDDQAQAAAAVSQTRDLINSGAVAIVSAFTAPPLAQEPIAARAHIPVFNGGGNDPSLLGKEYLWNDVLMADQEARAGMTFLHDTLGIKKIGILFETDYTPKALEALEAAWKSFGATEASVQSVDQSATTVGPQLEKLLADKPDALYIAVDGNIATLTFKELAQRNVKIPLMGQSGTAFVPEASNTPALQFYYTAQIFTPTPEFEAAAKKAGIDSPTYLHETYFNIGQTIAQALKTAQEEGLEPNGEGIQTVLKKSPAVSFSGCCGDITYTESHGAHAKITIYQIVDGKPVKKAELDAT